MMPRGNLRCRCRRSEEKRDTVDRVDDAEYSDRENDHVQYREKLNQINEAREMPGTTKPGAQSARALRRSRQGARCRHRHRAVLAAKNQALLRISREDGGDGIAHAWHGIRDREPETAMIAYARRSRCWRRQKSINRCMETIGAGLDEACGKFSLFDRLFLSRTFRRRALMRKKHKPRRGLC